MRRWPDAGCRHELLLISRGDDGLYSAANGEVSHHGDAAGLQRFTAAVGRRVQIVGDDFLVTNAERVRHAAADGACNAVLVKPNQAGTVTEAKAALDASRAARWGAIVSARSGETEDVTIVHLAVGWGVAQLKVGSFARSERMAKWNEGLRIEEALGGRARFAGGRPLDRQRRKA